MTRPLRISWQAVAVAGGIASLCVITAAIWFGLQVPLQWSTDVWAGGTRGSGAIILPPFPALSTVTVFDINVQAGGRHFYLLGSDAGGRDLLALVARGAIPSLELVLAVVVARFIVGTVIGFAMGMGVPLMRELGIWLGSITLSFPYIALAAITVQAIAPKGRPLAFVIAMSLVGWRDVAELVAERVEYVRGQPFSLAAAALGTDGLRFFRLHVVPFLRPSLGVELPFQISAVLVLLAELGYVQVFLGPSLITLENYGGSATVLITQPELGQLLSLTRDDIQAGQFGVALIPALTIALIALSFELIGTGVRGRTRLGG
jgi:peptide/nickel transport system permease protein